MRLLYVTSAPEGRGTFHRAFNLAKHLALRGHHIRLICADSSGRFRIRCKNLENVEVVTLPYGFNLAKWLVAQAVNGGLISARIFGTELDLVHFFATNHPSVAFSLFTTRFKAFLSKWSVFTDWDDWWGEGGIYASHGIVAERVGTFLEERPQLMGHATTVVSKMLYMRAIRLGLRNVFKVPNGADIDHIQPLSKRIARQVLHLPEDFVIYCHVGGAQLHNMFSLVREKIPNSMVVIVGGRTSSNSITDKLGIFHVGQQPLKTIVTYLAAADILLLSTRNQISEAARWPIRLGDYLASGRPVVAGDIGEIGSVIRDARCGLLARPGDEKDFAHKSIQLGLNPKTWEELGSNARRAAEQKFAWSLIADDLDHIYNTFQRRS